MDKQLEEQVKYNTIIGMREILKPIVKPFVIELVKCLKCQQKELGMNNEEFSDELRRRINVALKEIYMNTKN